MRSERVSDSRGFVNTHEGCLAGLLATALAAALARHSQSLSKVTAFSRPGSMSTSASCPLDRAKEPSSSWYTEVPAEEGGAWQALFPSSAAWGACALPPSGVAAPLDPGDMPGAKPESRIFLVRSQCCTRLERACPARGHGKTCQRRAGVQQGSR